MKNNDCVLCGFENPKATVTALVIKDGKLLVVRRNEEPYKDHWDFIGGYIQKNETPEMALKREIKEETNCEVQELTYIGAFSGSASYGEYTYPILSLAYLVEITGEIRLNEENSEFTWIPLTSPEVVAFDSNQKIFNHLKEKFQYDLAMIRNLVAQLDPMAKVDEQSLYKAIFDGYISRIEENGKIIGMGWIFPRQTMLRRQAVIEDMIVDQTYRGCGLGEKILHDLLQWAKAKGIEVVELTTNPKRIAANNLYQKVGFKFHETNHYLLNLDTYGENTTC